MVSSGLRHPPVSRRIRCSTVPDARSTLAVVDSPSSSDTIHDSVHQPVAVAPCQLSPAPSPDCCADTCTQRIFSKYFSRRFSLLHTYDYFASKCRFSRGKFGSEDRPVASTPARSRSAMFKRENTRLRLRMCLYRVTCSQIQTQRRHIHLYVCIKWVKEKYAIFLA